MARQASSDDTSEPGPVSERATINLVIDTNVLFDWFVFADPALDVLASAVRASRVRWIATPAMLDEFWSVLRRPLDPRWEDARKRALTLEINALCEHWPGPVPQAPAGLRCRDPDDQKFIDLALAGGASALITRDRALLDLRRRALAYGVSIVAPTQWHAPRTTASIAP